MKTAEFEKKLKRIGLEKKHVDEAFKWIRKHGEQGVHDIFWYRTRPSKEKNAVSVLDKEKNRYFMREAGILIYLFACKDKGEKVGKPPFDKQWELNKIEKCVHRYLCEKMFKNLRIEIKRYGPSGEEVDSSVRVNKKSSSIKRNARL